MQFTEAFWMEAIIESLISAGAVIIAAIISHYAATKKTNMIIEKLPAEHKEILEKQSTKYKELLAEQQETKKWIFLENEKMTHEHTELSNKLHTQEKLLNKVIAHQDKLEAIDNKMPEESRLVGLVKEVYGSNYTLKEELGKTKEKLFETEKENLLLQGQIKTLKEEIYEKKQEIKNLQKETGQTRSKDQYEHDEYEL